MYLKRKLYIVVNECSFELGRISFMTAGVIKIVRLDLYGPPCKFEFQNCVLDTISNTRPSNAFPNICSEIFNNV